MGKNGRADSVQSEDFDGSDADHIDGQPATKKTKESTRDADQRKVQNRIAQREFRQRKQQYIRDLEARLELHESAPNEQLDQMKTGIRALMDENQQLRSLLASLAQFVGEGLGGSLARLQVELPEFQNLISRSRMDVLHETLDARHAAAGSSTASSSGIAARPALAHGGSSSSTSPQRSATTSAGPSNPSKRASILNPPSTSNSAVPPYLASSGRAGSAPLGSPIFPAPLPARSASVTGGVTVASPLGQAHSPMGGTMGVCARTSESPASVNSSGPTRGQPPADTAEDRERLEKSNQAFLRSIPQGQQGLDEYTQSVEKLFSQPSDNPKLQAIQLIAYHMKNKRDNPAYKLPPALRATITQSSVPHSPFFDGIIFASMRDRLILLKDQYDLAELLGDLVDAVTIHEQDCLVPANWELSESFMRKYWYVIDQEPLAIANRWRKERGEHELAMRDIVP